MADVIQRFYTNGRVAEQWDDSTSTYTAFTEAGVQTLSRAYTAQESTAASARAAATQQDINLAALQSKAQAAITANVNFVNSFTPTTAAERQLVLATRELTALIRIVLGLLDSTAGT